MDHVLKFGSGVYKFSYLLFVVVLFTSCAGLAQRMSNAEVSVQPPQEAILDEITLVLDGCTLIATRNGKESRIPLQIVGECFFAPNKSAKPYVKETEAGYMLIAVTHVPKEEQSRCFTYVQGVLVFGPTIRMSPKVRRFASCDFKDAVDEKNYEILAYEIEHGK